MSLCFEMPPPITTLSGSSIRILFARIRPSVSVQSSNSRRQQGSLIPDALDKGKAVELFAGKLRGPSENSQGGIIDFQVFLQRRNNHCSRFPRSENGCPDMACHPESGAADTGSQGDAQQDTAALAAAQPVLP